MAALDLGADLDAALELVPQAVAPAPLPRCDLCFATDHTRAICRLVVPAAEDVEASEDEEEDPEELVFGSGSSEGDDDGNGMDANIGDGFIPIVDGDSYLPAPDPELEALDAEDLENPTRPDYVDVYMPHTDMPHFDHLAYAFVSPPLQAPVPLIHQAVNRACRANRVSLLSSSRGACIAIFSSPLDQESAVNQGPFIGREASVHFERHDETDNRFLF
jgi:hypothetical protein